MWSFFERLTRAFPTPDKQQPPQNLWQFYRYYLRGFEKHIALLTIFNALQAVFEVMLFGFIGKLVDWLGTAPRDALFSADTARIWFMSLVLLLILPLIVTAVALLNYQGVMGNFPMAIRWRMHLRMLEQSMEFYNAEFSGRIATKVMQTALAVRESITSMLGVMLYILVYFVSMLVLMAELNWLLMLPVLLWLVLYIALQYYFIPKLKNISRAQADARSDMTGRIVDAYTNIATVKLFAHKDNEAQYAKRSMRAFLQTVYKQFRLLTVLEVLSSYLNNLLIFSMAALGIYLWTQEALSTGAIAVGITLALRLQGMSQWVRYELASLFEDIGTSIDGMQMLAKPIAVNDVDDAVDLKISQAAISFNKVNFSYRQERDSNLAVLNDLSLEIKGGEKIGLVGRSGAGKSTLVNTLLRFYDIDSGQISIDGQDISRVSQASLRANIGMVSQDTALLHRSVRENICYGNSNASEAELQQAIKRAKADEFIANLCDNQGNSGLEALVGERGVKLSGGQRQRIAIARVLLKDAPILLLDEATSALDSEVEAAIQSSLWELMQGKTVIAIAHRLSTIAAMDRLVVVDNGSIVETGTHQQLLAKAGIYANLWSRQTGGYLPD